jgi:hypothetical protein
MEQYPGNMPSTSIPGAETNGGGGTLSTAMQRSLSANLTSANGNPDGSAVPPPDAKFTLDEDEKVD